MAARSARWMRLGPLEPVELRAACRGLASAQARDSAPIVVWAREEGHWCAFALVVPRRFAPGRSWRWLSWALSPVVALFRHLGFPAYLEGREILLHGRRIALGGAETIGECAVVGSSFYCAWPREQELEHAFRLRVEAQNGWQFDTAWPDAAEQAAIARATSAQAAAV